MTSLQAPSDSLTGINLEASLQTDRGRDGVIGCIASRRDGPSSFPSYPHLRGKHALFIVIEVDRVGLSSNKSTTSSETAPQQRVSPFLTTTWASSALTFTWQPRSTRKHVSCLNELMRTAGFRVARLRMGVSCRLWGALQWRGDDVSRRESTEVGTTVPALDLGIVNEKLCVGQADRGEPPNRCLCAVGRS